ncbi:hypothetical protein J2X83_001666 [Brevibacillus nitrificans]|nr:hypothetical protein [Brevibacillus nitrificans]
MLSFFRSKPSFGCSICDREILSTLYSSQVEVIGVMHIETVFRSLSMSGMACFC